MGLRTAPVVRGSGERVLRTVGEVDYAEPRLGDVTLKVSGWIEDLRVNYVGQRVRKGAPLFTFYSPELLTAQEEFLLGQQQGEPAQSFGGDETLRSWDVPQTEIDELKRTGTLKKAITFVSPFEGWIIEKDAVEGMAMKAGERFYRIADLSKVWVYASIYEYQLPRVREGQAARVTLPYDPGQVFSGRVHYIYPHVDPTTRQIRVRLEFDNPSLDLKPRMYANVEIVTDPRQDALTAPQDAVINVGRRKEIDGVSRRVGMAFVQVAEGEFEPREVVLGEEGEDGQLQILAGLAAGDDVVVSGQFLLEAERKVKAANLKMLTKGSP